MKYFPVFLDLAKKKCVIVGGGPVAEGKIRQLLRAGASVTVVSPRSTAGIMRLASRGMIRLKSRRYKACDVARAFLVIAATSDRSVNEKVSREAGGLFNAVDMPDLCTFIMPSIISKGPLTIAVSTSGASPALARAIREDLERDLPDDIDLLLKDLRQARTLILRKMAGTSKEIVKRRSTLLKKMADRELLDLLRGKGLARARKHVRDLVKECM